MSKELNLKFKNCFVHVRTNAKIYRMAIDNGGTPIAFDISPNELASLCDGLVRIGKVIKK